MRQNIQTASIDFSYLAVILLLAYLLTSAPKYLKHIRSSTNDIKIQNTLPVKEVLKLGKYYGIDPYLKAWNRLSPTRDKTKPASSPTNLAAIQSPASR